MQRPNIVWLMADELRASSLGCYGGEWAPAATSAIDTLASRGVRFERHWCNSPACVPARTSLITARPPEETGVYGNEGAWVSFRVPLHHDTFPERLARAGYVTASFGKEHLPNGYAPWRIDRPEGSGMGEFAAAASLAELQPITPKGIASPVGGRFPADRPYPPEAVTRGALAWLAEPPDAPFLLRVSWLQPHTPVFPPEAYRLLYRAEDCPGHALPRRELSLFEDAFAEIVGGRALSHEQMQRAQADYQALVAWLDGQVGLILSMLRTRGLQRDTIVVLNSDHGASLGEDGLLGKVVFAPPSQRIPLIVSWPGRLPEGTVREDLTEALDLARTLFHLVGVEPDPAWAGRALFDPAAPEPEAILAVVGGGSEGAMASSASNIGGWPQGGGWPRRACLRTREWRFDMNVRQDGRPVAPDREDPFLAHSAADPREARNLAADPEQATRAAGFRSRLLERAARTVEAAFVPAFSKAEVGAFVTPEIGE